MPIYEYRCQDCGWEGEYQQRMSEDPKTECEKCQGRLERLISRSAFHLKGGGWYKDLYSSPKPGASDSSSAGASSTKSSDSGSSSSDSSSSSSSSDSSSSSSSSSKAAAAGGKSD